MGLSLRTILPSLYVILILIFSQKLCAQDVESYRNKLQRASDDSLSVSVEISRKYNYTGLVQEVSDSTFILNADIGRLELGIQLITDLRVLDKRSSQSDRRGWFENKHRDGLFINSTARMEEGLGGSYKNVWVLWSNLQFHPVDFLSFSAGFVNIPEVTFGESNFYSLGLKAGFDLKDTYHFSFNATRFNAFDESLDLLYPSFTYSKGDTDFTLGAGFSRRDNIDGAAFIMLGLQARVTERLALVSENILINEGELIISFGPRFLGRYVATDLGFIMVPEAGTAGILPLVSFSVDF